MSDTDWLAEQKARLAALRRADEEYVSVIANRPLDEPKYNYHLRAARREVEAHAPADLARCHEEIERMREEVRRLAELLDGERECAVEQDRLAWQTICQERAERKAALEVKP